MKIWMIKDITIVVYIVYSRLWCLCGYINACGDCVDNSVDVVNTCNFLSAEGSRR